jgi:demethylspheroidene O-methyltransferase
MPAAEANLPAPELRKPPLFSWRRWSDAWHAARDRLLESPRFQLFAARFPLTRGLAARRARQCFDLCAGFVYSQVLFACVKLDLFRRVARRPLTLDEIAGETGLSLDAARRLVLAAVSLELLEARPGARYGLGQLGAAMRGNPGVTAMIEHHALFYADMADPVALLRGEAGPTQLSRYWPYAVVDDPSALPSGAVGAYTDLMAASQSFIAADVIASYDLTRHARILDVGGGDGTFLRAVAKAAPKTALSLFDLPAVVEAAEPRFSAAGLASRVTLVGGSFTTDSLPRGADLITLVRVAHDHDDEVVEVLLAKAFQALEPGGKLLIAEPMAGPKEAATFADAYFGFYLLAMGSGRARPPAELKAMLARAGFVRPRQVSTPRPLMTGLLLAEKEPITVKST